jgi:GntR family transcriptional regulator, phosphonate transport system regulatory protein
MAGQTPPATATRMYASIRDQLASEINAGVYPPGALLPSIREIMQRWDVSTTTARRVLDELAVSGYARKEGTRGHISTGGGAQAQQASPTAESGHSRKAPPPVGISGRLTIRPVHTVPADGSVSPDAAGTPTLDVRAERPPADAALALRVADPMQPAIVRRRLLSAADGTPVELRVSYLPTELAEGTRIAQAQAIPEDWPAALATCLGRKVRLASSHVTARHPNQEEAAALALASDAAVLVREDNHEDQDGNALDYTRTVWPGDSTRLAISG